MRQEEELEERKRGRGRERKRIENLRAQESKKTSNQGLDNNLSSTRSIEEQASTWLPGG